LGVKTLEALTRQNSRHVVKLPTFDKASDDILQQSEWRSVDAPVDVVLFEGWCVAARPQSDECLNAPVNTLEAEDDPDGVWRRFANENLKDGYLELFGWIDALIMLRVPSLDQVFEWRALQEQKLRGDADAADSDKTSPGGMNTAELRRFVMHFERLTRHMLETMPDYANTVIDIDDSHNMADMTHRNWPCEGASRDPRT
jgi:D-glycerate 3-kinase